MLKINNEIVPITVFPDGTHQVWKLTDSQINYTETSDEVEVFWEFENQAELFDVMQLADILIHHIPVRWSKQLVLNCPYLPYARQDKPIANNSCFALTTFVEQALRKFDKIRTVDVHNPSFFNRGSIELENTFPVEAIRSIISNEKVDLIIFPDEGAMARYRPFIPLGIDFISAQKQRDQLTGHILGITIDAQVVNEAKNVLVWDDICDGGGTFVGLASLISVPNLMLYVTHGIFSKGTACLFCAGYNKIFTRNGEVK